jgi:hypothetical protein
MALTVEYFAVGMNVVNDVSWVTMYIWWKDFNPSVPSWLIVSNETIFRIIEMIQIRVK